jgi:hypothetical protein
MRRANVGIVLLLVLAAGCTGPASDAGGTDTPTETATQTPAPTLDSYPDGWSESGVEDAEAARDAHYRAVLAGPSATVEYRSRVVESENDLGNDTTLRMALDTDTQRLVADIDGRDAHREVYFADGRLSRWDVVTRSVVSESQTEFRLVAQSIDRNVLLSHLLLYELEQNGTVRQEGMTARRYEVTGVHPNTLSNSYGAATSGEGHLVVGPNGRMLELETTVTYERATVRYRYAHTRLGETTVSAPDWRS